MAPTKTKQWTLTNHPRGEPTYQGEENATFTLEDKDLPELQDDEVLVQSLYFSNDPAQRTWISDKIGKDKHYVAPVQVGEPMRTRGLAKVLESKSSSFKVGDVISGRTGWREYAVLPAAECLASVESPGLPITANLGTFSITGMTAYYGLVMIAGAKKGDKITVSGAGGATGSVVVQIAKNVIGCKTVIGIAGSDDKCKWVESIGADKCLNYKSKTFEDDLKETAKDSDVYFDNVGGATLDQMLGLMKRHGVIAACGAISTYNQDGRVELKNFNQVFFNRLSIRGFIIVDAEPKYQEIVKILSDAYHDGKIKVDEQSETVIPTRFEDIPKTWLKLFEGGNQGKLITELVSG